MDREGNRHLCRSLALSCAAVLLSSCATVTSGATQTITIASEPPGASCELRRDGALLMAVRSTPEAVVVPRSKKTINFACRRADHETTTEMLESKFTGATVGNVLVGGLIGVAVDAASGANNYYPSETVVIMQPTIFADEAAREAFFGRLSDRVRRRAASDLVNRRNQCTSKPREFCEADAARIGQKRDKDLADIDARRLASRVALPVTGNTTR